MNEQPEALRLADAIKNSISPEASLPLGDWARAAAELRRLHEVNQELLKALLMILDDPSALDGRPRTYKYVQAAIAKARGESNE